MEPHKSFDFFKNFGISENILTLKSNEFINSDVYIIRQDAIKKNFSAGAIQKVSGSGIDITNFKSKDDMDQLYDDCDQEYAVFGVAEKFDTQTNQKLTNDFNGKFNINQNNQNSNFTLFNNQNDLNRYDYLNDLKSACTKTLYNQNYFSKNDELNKQTQCNRSFSTQTFSNNENCEIIYEKLQNKKICLKKNIQKIASKALKKQIDNSKENSSPCYEEDFIKNNLNTQNNKYHKDSKIRLEADETSKEIPIDVENGFISENIQKIKDLKKIEELKNGIFKNSMQNQMEQLDRIFQEMNQSSEAKVTIKAYKSKLKTKFYKIYESNSDFYKEKNKHKIFHKCNFPGCSRTFASAGWLKSHFTEHLEELKSNKFNLEFEKSLIRLKNINLLK